LLLLFAIFHKKRERKKPQSINACTGMVCFYPENSVESKLLDWEKFN